MMESPLYSLPVNPREKTSTQRRVQHIAFIALLLLVFVIPWERSVGLGGIGIFSRAFGILAFLLGALSTLDDNKIRLRTPSLFLVSMGSFILWSVLSAFWSDSPKSSVARSITYVQLMMMVWLIWQLCRTPKQHAALMQAYILGAYVLVGSVLVDFATNFGSTTYRADGLDSNANWAALAIALAMPMACYLIAESKRNFWSWFNYLYVPLALFSVGLTASRGGFIVSSIGLSVIPFLFWKLELWKKIVLLMILIAAIYGAFNYLPEANIGRLSETSTELTEGDLTNRKFIWMAAGEVFWDSPIIGVGSSGFRDAITPVYGTDKASHNAFIGIGVELGIIGFMLFSTTLLIAVLPLVIFERGAYRFFYLILWTGLMVALMPANWEIHKATWFILALLTSRKAFVISGFSSPSLATQSIPESQPQSA